MRKIKGEKESRSRKVEENLVNVFNALLVCFVMGGVFRMY